MFTLIDGDIIVYSCGFASQKNKYSLPIEYTGTKRYWDKKKDVNKFCDDRGIDKGEIEKEIIPDPLPHALQNVKQTLLHIAETCDSHDGEIYLTGKGNYRETVAVTYPYKGNRDTLHKPYWYGEITDYLIDHWDAKVIDGMEADDAMGIKQWKDFSKAQKFYIKEEADTFESWYSTCNPTIICTIDKDLDMIPGWHYNWTKGKKYFVSEEEADYFFDLQMLMGDRVDNIYAIKGIGPKKAEKLLKGKSKTERDAIIQAKYQSHFGGAEGMARYMENKQLLWILREERT